MPFRITGLSPQPFQHLFGLSDQQLRKHGARRYVADSKPGYPDLYDRVNEVPEVLRLRTISLRAFDAEDLMVDAKLVNGAELAIAIERLFTDSGIAYIHAHYAKRGCYAARIDRC